VNGVTTRYLVDDLSPSGYSQVVEELVDGSVQRVYTHGNRPISQDQQLNGQWQASFYGYDAHGNVRFLTGADGAVTDTYDYDAFGVLTSSTGVTPNPYLFNGQQYDRDLGLYFKRARYYSQDRGRFLTMDPVPGRTAEPATLHRYVFGHADPVNRMDPCGTTAILDNALITRLVIGSTIASLGYLSYTINCRFYQEASVINIGPPLNAPPQYSPCLMFRGNQDDDDDDYDDDDGDDDDREERCYQQYLRDLATCRGWWPYPGTRITRGNYLACQAKAGDRQGECLTYGRPISPLEPWPLPEAFGG
jgi:RHS repeat-associated protein